jgi:hypothetical protein
LLFRRRGIARLGRRRRTGGLSLELDPDVRLQGLVRGLHHVDEDLQVLAAFNVVQLLSVILQAVHEPFLKASREGFVDVFEPTVRSDILLESRHRPPLHDFQG